MACAKWVSGSLEVINTRLRSLHVKAKMYPYLKSGIIKAELMGAVVIGKRRRRNASVKTINH